MSYKKEVKKLIKKLNMYTQKIRIGPWNYTYSHVDHVYCIINDLIDLAKDNGEDDDWDIFMEWWSWICGYGVKNLRERCRQDGRAIRYAPFYHCFLYNENKEDMDKLCQSDSDIKYKFSKTKQNVRRGLRIKKDLLQELERENRLKDDLQKLKDIISQIKL
jgi:hypothetical protein